MKLDQFNLWLKGFLAALGSNPLSKQHFDILKEKINSVEFPTPGVFNPNDLVPRSPQIDWEKIINDKQKQEHKDIWPIRPYEGPTYYPYPRITPLTPNDEYVRPMIGDPIWNPNVVYCKGEN